MPKKTWSELSDAQKTAILVVGSVELALTATALVDLARRPAAQIVHDSRLDQVADVVPRIEDALTR